MPGKIVLMGEPMGLFIAREPGDLSEVKSFACSIAGAEYNVAVGLSRLGHTAMYCTKLGVDPLGRKIIKGMEQNGISTALVQQTEEYLTGSMMKSMVENGDPAIYYYRKNSAASTMNEQDVDALQLSGCTWLHVTGITPAISSSALAATKHLIIRATALDMMISFDPNLRPQLWQDRETMVNTLNDLAQHAHVIMPGIKEGQILTQKDTPDEFAEFYHRMGVKNVVVKLGEKGAYYSVKGDRAGTVPAFTVKTIVDTVGAGDGFAAGLVSGLAEGMPLEEAVFRANVIGAIQVTHKSDNEGLPTKEQLHATVQQGFV